MFKVWDTDNRKLSLHITITSKSKKTFRVASSDYGKVNSKYSDRNIDVEGKRTIFLSFPISPKQVIVGVQNLRDQNDTDFEVVIEEKPLPTYNVWLDAQTRDFLQLGLVFSQTCGFEDAHPRGRLITSIDKEFKIKYFPIIKDYLSGRSLSTPARIGHKSGIIEVSKMRFDKYTIPMRMMILLHEFSHKYKNPTMDLPISDEIGADINALYIYLGMGFSKVDAIYVYANVFLSAQTDQNMQRMKKIVDYINKFSNEEFAKKLI